MKAVTPAGEPGNGISEEARSEPERIMEIGGKPILLPTVMPLSEDDAGRRRRAAAHHHMSGVLLTSATGFAGRRIHTSLLEVRARVAGGERAALPGGAPVRDYLDVRDAARMFADLALGHELPPVNIRSGIPIIVRATVVGNGDEPGRRNLLRNGASR